MRKLSAEEAAQYDNMIKGAQQMSLEDLQQGRLFGYCRISTPKQKLQRQIDNIKAKYPDAAFALMAAENLFTGDREQCAIHQEAYFSILQGENLKNVRFRFEKEMDAYVKEHMWDD